MIAQFEIQHPLPAGTTVSYFKTIYNSGRATVLSLERIVKGNYWYKLSNGQEASSYDILSAKLPA